MSALSTGNHCESDSTKLQQVQWISHKENPIMRRRKLHEDLELGGKPTEQRLGSCKESRYEPELLIRVK